MLQGGGVPVCPKANREFAHPTFQAPTPIVCQLWYESRLNSIPKVPFEWHR